MRKRFLTLAVIGLIITNGEWVLADVNGLSFSSEAQIAAVSVTTDKITVQANDKIAETGDLYLTSTSATGQFSSNNANWQIADKLTMSKNTASRSFYYKDETAGNYTLTAKLTLRASGISWSATQKITIGTASTTETSPPPIVATTTPSASTTPETAAPTSNLSSISAHNSPLPTSTDIKPRPPLVADAGRERIGVIHAPLNFRAAAFDQAGKKVGGLDTIWSFGDGTTAHGETVEHTYAYPGDYVLVMNTQNGDLTAVDRTLVHILPNRLTITRAVPGMMNDEIEITNQGQTEMNLERWSLTNNAQSYTFPSDTIILPGRRLTLPYAVTKIMIPEGSGLSLLAPDKTTMAAFTPSLALPKIAAPPIPPAPPADRPTLSAGRLVSLTPRAAASPSLIQMRRMLVSLQKEIAPRVVRSYRTPIVTRPHAVQSKVAATAASSSPIIVIKKKPTGFLANIMSLFK